MSTLKPSNLLTFKPLISVIITTKNEEENIGRCLESIRKQSYPNEKIEVIVVDNHSTDKTKEIIKNFKLSNLKTFKPSNLQLYSHGPERSAQRNYGIKKAKGEYILFLDADMSLSEKVIEECVDKFKSHKVIKSKVYKVKKLSNLINFKNIQTNNLVGLYIPERIVGDSYWCKVRNFERSFYNATVIDCVRFFPKKVWEEVGGFDETLIAAEDWDFDKKLRMKGEVDIVQSALFHNEQDFNLKEYLKGKSYYSKSIPRYIKKWGKDEPDIKKQFGLWYRYFGVFIEDSKWKKLVAHPVLALGMLFLKLLVGIKYLTGS